MSGMPPPCLCSSSFGDSATNTSVVSNRPATEAASQPAFATIWRSGSSIERDRILMPMAWSSFEPSSFSSARCARIRATPPCRGTSEAGAHGRYFARPLRARSLGLDQRDNKNAYD
jgi:hypothetical protein